MQREKINKEKERQLGRWRQKIGVIERNRTRPVWAGFKTAEEGRANTPFGVGEPRG